MCASLLPSTNAFLARGVQFDVTAMDPEAMDRQPDSPDPKWESQHSLPRQEVEAYYGRCQHVLRAQARYCVHLCIVARAANPLV